MSEIKQIKIDRHDSNKYKCTSVSGSDTFARVYYKDDGSLDEKLTYNKHYYAELHPKEEDHEEENIAFSAPFTSYTSNNSSTEEDDNWLKKVLENRIAKFILTIIPVLPIWWVIKCPISWLTYPIRKAIKVSNDKGNVLWPDYCFKEGDGLGVKILGTITLTLPVWWIIKLLGNALTILPRMFLNIWTIENDRFWPRYSFISKTRRGCVMDLWHTLPCSNPNFA